MQAGTGITMAAIWMTRLRPSLGKLPLRKAVNEIDHAAEGDPEAGFTLLEILVVIVILGLLIGLVAPAVLRQLGGARVSIAHQSIARLGSVLDMYKLDVGSYPSTDQGLEALVQAPAGVSNWNGPYVNSGKLPIDPWNHPYVYRDPSDRAGHDYDLCSTGPSGTATGDDMICN
jgi:general secretion pathway protein G